MKLNEDELISQMNKYFKDKSKEEIIRDIIKAGGASLFDLEEPEKNYTVAYVYKERYCNSYFEHGKFVYKDKNAAINEILDKGFTYDNDNKCYYKTGDISFTMWAFIEELIVVE